MEIDMIDDKDTASLDDQLIDAAHSARFDQVKRLLEVGADVKAVNEYGNTALHYASGINDIKIAILLVKAGADVNLKNGGGETPLEIAESSGHTLMTEILRHPEKHRSEESWSSQNQSRKDTPTKSL